MIKISYISLNELSKIIKIHVKTLKAWLCHYSLARFVRTKYRIDGKFEYEFAITKASVKTLNRYLSKKKRQNLQIIDDKICTKK